jgi:hypothetical protein
LGVKNDFILLFERVETDNKIGCVLAVGLFGHDKNKMATT